MRIKIVFDTIGAERCNSVNEETVQKENNGTVQDTLFVGV